MKMCVAFEDSGDWSLLIQAPSATQLISQGQTLLLGAEANKRGCCDH